MKIRVEIEKEGGKWVARLLAPDNVVLTETVGGSRDEVLREAGCFLHIGASILG